MKIYKVIEIYNPTKREEEINKYASMGWKVVSTNLEGNILVVILEKDK
jgi:hypothetical protein